MRALVTLIALATLLAACDSGAGAPRPRDWQMAIERGPMSPEEIESSLTALGLVVTRLSYQAPDPHHLIFRVDEYRDGEEHIDEDVASISVGVGEVTILVFMRREGSSVNFSMQVGGSRVGGSDFSLEGFSGSTWSALDSGPLHPGARVPIFAFAMDEGGIQGFSADTPVQEIVQSHDLTLMVTAELAP
jgi:hypothetical protein